MKFRLKEDWYVDDFFDKVKIYNEGEVFTPNENGKYIIHGLNDTKMILSCDEMLKSNNGNELLFEPIKEQEIELIVEEVKDDEIEDVKKWRIQLDVNTTQSKLKEIQKFIQENIPDML